MELYMQLSAITMTVKKISFHTSQYITACLVCVVKPSGIIRSKIQPYSRCLVCFSRNGVVCLWPYHSAESNKNGLSNEFIPLEKAVDNLIPFHAAAFHSRSVRSPNQTLVELDVRVHRKKTLLLFIIKWLSAIDMWNKMTTYTCTCNCQLSS